jgi:hypothetical protein
VRVLHITSARYSPCNTAALSRVSLCVAPTSQGIPLDHQLGRGGRQDACASRRPMRAQFGDPPQQADPALGLSIAVQQKPVRRWPRPSVFANCCSHIGAFGPAVGWRPAPTADGASGRRRRRTRGPCSPSCGCSRTATWCSRRDGLASVSGSRMGAARSMPRAGNISTSRRSVHGFFLSRDRRESCADAVVRCDLPSMAPYLTCHAVPYFPNRHITRP